MKFSHSWLRWLALSWRRLHRRYPSSMPVCALLVAVAVIGLSQSGQLSRRWTSWKHHQWSLAPISTHRAPASFEGCEDTPVRLEQVVAENAQMEKSFPSTHDMQGRWLHLDLSKLSFAKARFLSRLPETIYRPHAESLKTCEDISCIFNVLTSDADQEYGTLVWHWFLKTGLVIQWHESELSFSKQELKQFWTLSHHLTPDFFHHHSVTSVEKSQLPENQCVALQEGKIYLSPQCSSNYKLHLTTGLSAALLPQWLQKFPAWKGKLTAQQVSEFVLHGEASPEAKEFLHTHLFKREWSLEGDMHREFKRDQWVWRDVKSRHLKDCLDLHKTAIFNKPRYRGIASLSEPHPMAQCLRQTAVPEFLQSKKSWLSGGHTRSCEWNKPLPQGQVAIDAYLSHWEKLLTKDIDQLEWRMRADGPEWLRHYQLKEASLARMDPTWVYFECHDQANPKSCYQQGLSELFVQQSRVPASIKEELLEDYPFEALDERVREDVGSKRQWHLHNLERQAARAWRSCWSQGPNEMVRLHRNLKWVSASENFIDGRFAACLEKSSDEILGQIGSDDSPEARYWRDEMSAPLKAWWKREIAKEAQQERGWLREDFSRVKTALAYDLRHLMEKSATFDAQDSCLKRLTFHYPPIMFFHARQQLNQHVGPKICNEVLTSPLIKKSLVEHKARRSRVISSELQAAIANPWQERVRQNCLGRVPAAQTKALLQTDAVATCMKEQFELTWPMATQEVAKRHHVSGESLEQFKDHVHSIAQVLLSQQLQP